MSFDQRLWSSTGSTLSPMILVLRLSNSGLRPAMYPSSVVHTGVKSLGCENRIAHLSPIQSWKWILPSVVSAVKSGASSPMRMAMLTLHCLCGVGCAAVARLATWGPADGRPEPRVERTGMRLYPRAQRHKRLRHQADWQ